MANYSFNATIEPLTYSNKEVVVFDWNTLFLNNVLSALLVLSVLFFLIWIYQYMKEKKVTKIQMIQNLLLHLFFELFMVFCSIYWNTYFILPLILIGTFTNTITLSKSSDMIISGFQKLSKGNH